jgi:hypothetical protein
VSSFDTKDQPGPDEGRRFIVTQQLGGAPTAAAATGPAQPIIDRQLRDILGWQPKDDDPGGFSTALARSFQAVVVEGVEHWEYAPYGSAIPAERADSAITGAQGSIYNRALVAQKEMQALLAALFPLSPIADLEQAEASRRIIASLIDQIVSELGAEGGPTALLVDGLWAQILGVSPGQDPPTDPDSLDEDSAIGAVATRFYLSRQLVNLPGEEENYTKFLSLFDYLASLYTSWKIQRPFFTGTSGQDPYFGTQLVFINRALQIVVENIDELIGWLDGSDIGQAERQNMCVDLPDGTSIYFQGTLDWIRNYCGEQAPALIDTAGRDGAISTYVPLYTMGEVIENFKGAPPEFPSLYGDSPLIQASVKSLISSLKSAAERVGRLGPPQAILDVMPLDRLQSPATTRPLDVGPTATTPPVLYVIQPTRGNAAVIEVQDVVPGDEFWLIPGDADTDDLPANGVQGSLGQPVANWTPVRFELTKFKGTDTKTIALVVVRAGTPYKLKLTPIY